MKKPPLIILSGATAVGKTDLSIHLAQKIGGEIISADSMQVYKGFDIGTAKISKEEMQGVPHYLIDELEPDEEFNVFEFQKRASSYIRSIHAKGKIPIITGGTGFYIQSVLYDIEFTSSETDTSYRRELEQFAKEQGPQALHHLLEEADPEAAGQIHANNIKRTIRALEYFKETGQRISLHNEQQRLRHPAFNAAYFVLNRDRDVIYDRINQRVDIMLQQGLVQEVRSLLERGVSPDSLAMQGLGYKEIIRYLNNELTYEEAVDLIKKSTRHFAKRQLTWFRREKDVIWMNYEEYLSEEEMLAKMIDLLKEKNIVPLS
ncbi:MAG: tRNA (adenosine(37)-N6)-dimethylallyltransferase MiaA [Parasporobacterium sp.]|nr:tRNA (adenosine(37)-N6)-dimethylallyltransferase MiaA [Parasporobacterium sp.]